MYSKEMFIEAEKIISLRRDRAEREAAERADVIFLEHPEIGRVNREIRSIGSRIVDAVLGGGDVAGTIQRLGEHLEGLKETQARLLRETGLDPSSLTPQYACPLCRDTGLVENKVCSCMKAVLKNLVCKELNRSTPLELSSFEDFDLSFYPAERDAGGVSPAEHMKRVFAFCKQYAASFHEHSQSLLLYGATGLGKTHLSLAIARGAIDKGYYVIYGSAQNLLSRIEREHFSREAENASSEDALLSCDLLILDDLGTEFLTSFVLSVLNNIINSRILSGRPTIISTTLSVTDIRKTYPERITSRIIGNYTPLLFLGKDIRQQKAMRRKG